MSKEEEMGLSRRSFLGASAAAAAAVSAGKLVVRELYNLHGLWEAEQQVEVG